MNEGLLRGINSLNYYIQNYPEATPLERYALFSAGLLLEVAYVVVNQKIFITDEEGNFIKQWNPFNGPLIDDVEIKHYKIMPLSSYYQRNIPSITPILVRQLLPDEGFLWLTSDMRLFSIGYKPYAMMRVKAEGVLNMFYNYLNIKISINYLIPSGSASEFAGFPSYHSC